MCLIRRIIYKKTGINKSNGGLLVKKQEWGDDNKSVVDVCQAV